ncbi:MAG: HAMP domain-containing protein [Planctomycetota bacterium]|jgi:methyl-accepting chemotaxis protein
MLKNLKIGVQIGLGFGLVLVFMAVMAWFAIAGLRSGSESFKEYRGLARATVLSSRVQANMLMASNAAKDFLDSRDERHLEVFSERLRSAQSFAAQQQAAIVDPDRRRMSEQLATSLEEYQQVAGEVFMMMQRRDAVLQETLNPQGTRMRRNLTEIMVSAQEDADPEAAYYAGRALERVLLGRLYLLKFLEDNGQAEVERVRSELGPGFKQAFDEMVSQIDDPERKRLLQDFSAARDIYVGAFEQMVSLIESRNALIAQKLEPLDRSVADISEQIKLSLKVDQDTVGPAVQSRNDATVRAVLIGAPIAVGLAIVIALSIIGTVTRPINELAETVRGVQATGDLSQRSNVRSTDEIGLMAAALNDFLGSLEGQAKAVDEVSLGNLEVRVEPASDRDVLASSLNRLIQTLREVSRQADVISSGDYSARISPRSAQDTLGTALQRMTATLRESAQRPPCETGPGPGRPGFMMPAAALRTRTSWERG